MMFCNDQNEWNRSKFDEISHALIVYAYRQVSL